MLNLSLTAVARGQARVRGEIAPDDPVWAGTGLELQGPLQADLTAASVGEGILVRGPIRARVKRACRRCLSEVPVEVDEVVDLLYEPLQGEDAEELEGEVYPLPQRGDEVELAPALREQLLLRVPEFVVCREECRGLCPRCGTNLNEAECQCEPEAEPGPWDALKNVKFD